MIKGLQAFSDIEPRSGAFLIVYKTLLSIPGLIKNPVISNASNSVTILQWFTEGCLPVSYAGAYHLK